MAQAIFTVVGPFTYVSGIIIIIFEDFMYLLLYVNQQEKLLLK